MKNSKNLVNDLNVLNNQKTKYIDNYRDLFSLLDQFCKNKRESIIISAGAGDISAKFVFFMTQENKNLITNYSSAKFSWLKSGGNISHLYKIHNQIELNKLFSQNDIKSKSLLVHR